MKRDSERLVFPAKCKIHFLQQHPSSSLSPLQLSLIQSERGVEHQPHRCWFWLPFNMTASSKCGMNNCPINWRDFQMCVCFHTNPDLHSMCLMSQKSLGDGKVEKRSEPGGHCRTGGACMLAESPSFPFMGEMACLTTPGRMNFTRSASRRWRLPRTEQTKRKVNPVFWFLSGVCTATSPKSRLFFWHVSSSLLQGRIPLGFRNQIRPLNGSGSLLPTWP